MGIDPALTNGLQRRIQGSHGTELLIAGAEMLQHRGSPFSPFDQTPLHLLTTLLQPHPMAEPVLLLLQQQPLLGVVELGCFESLQLLFLVGAVLQQGLLLGSGLLQSRGRLSPQLLALAHRLQHLREFAAAKTIQPTPLLPGASELLGLPLASEIQQQGAQLREG